MLKKTWSKFINFIGHVCWHGINNPLWITFKETKYKLTGEDYNTISSIIKPGDILLRRTNRFIYKIFLPSFWNHAGICVSNNTIIHAIGEGVVKEYIFDFAKCDELMILRPPPEMVDQAIEKAHSIIGKKYDFLFDFSDFENFSCTEVIMYCYQGIINTRSKFGKTICLGDDIANSPELITIWTSKLDY
jgi:uncharacterized protein YycO